VLFAVDAESERAYQYSMKILNFSIIKWGKLSKFGRNISSQIKNLIQNSARKTEKCSRTAS